MARISFITSVVLVSGLLTGCLESGSGTAQYNPYKDRPNIKPPIQTPEYDDTVADANALITGMHSRSELQVRNWIGFKLQGFNPTGFDVISADDYIDVANLANQITTANAAQIQSAYATDSNILWAAMAVLNRSLAASCFDATSGANTAECLVNWRNNNTAVFDTSRTELADNAIVLTVDNATLTATNDYKMKFKIDDTGEIIGMTLTRDSGDVNLKKFGDSDFYGPDNENKTVLELAYDSLGKEMGLSYSDFGLFGITSSMGDEQSQSPDEFSVPFAGGYDDKKIAVADIDTDMSFSGRAVGTATKGDESINLAGTAILNFTTGDSPVSELTANFNNWYNVNITQTGATSDAQFVFTGTPTKTDVILTNTTGTGTMNIGYYGPDGTPTEATGLAQFTESGVENGVKFDMAFGVNKK